MENENSVKKPKVSVCVITYNQSKYIGKCLQSLVDQKTNFKFEIIVSDDCSTDGTRDIICEFKKKYPEIIKPILLENNVGIQANYLNTHNIATGQYIAHMDGDDYALPGKLQKQADYLDNHPMCNILWHRMYIMNDTTGVVVPDLLGKINISKYHFDRGAILRLVAIGMHSSKMYRASVRNLELPHFPVLDYFINVEQVGNGYAKVLFTEKPLGVYRTGIGVSNASDKIKGIINDSLLYFMQKYPEQKASIGCTALILFAAAVKNRKWKNCIVFFKTLIKSFGLESLYHIWKEKEIISALKIPSTVRAKKVY